MTQIGNWCVLRWLPRTRPKAQGVRGVRDEKYDVPLLDVIPNACEDPEGSGCLLLLAGKKSDQVLHFVQDDTDF